MPKQHERPSGRGLQYLKGLQGPLPRDSGGPPARRNLVLLLSPASTHPRQTAAHQHPLRTPPTPLPVRQAPISGCRAHRPSTRRTEKALRCGYLAKNEVQHSGCSTPPWRRCILFLAQVPASFGAGMILPMESAPQIGLVRIPVAQVLILFPHLRQKHGGQCTLPLPDRGSVYFSVKI